MEYAADAARADLALIGAVGDGARTILLLAPREPGFWPAFTASPEFSDGQPDPMDRWSKRVIGGLAQKWRGQAMFPSDGPPYPPFIAWALASGRVWVAPVGLLVDAQQGLWLSFRGAVRVAGDVELPPAQSPCDTCAGQPCRQACPVNALTPSGYDVAACKAFLDRPAGADCRNRGCAARRACPVAAAHGRNEDQSRFHMRAFHPQ